MTLKPSTARFVLAALFSLYSNSVAQFWSSQTSGTTSNLFSVKALSSTVAWACGEAGTVLRTTNGGANWLKVSIPFTGLNCYSIEALDATTAWVVAVNPTGSTSALYKTTDGGASWGFAKLSSAAPGTFYNAVRFYDRQNGILVGDPENGYFVVYTTTDGGETWTRTLQASMPAPLSGEVGLTDNLEVSGNNAWFGTGHLTNTTSTRVFRSTDRGKSWSVSSVLSGLGNTINSMAFTSEQNGLLLGSNGSVMRTQDAGVTWTSLTATGLPAGSHLSFATPSSVVAVGSGGGGFNTAYVSTDGGTSWSVRSAPLNNSLYGVSYASSSVGWAVGATGVIYRWIGGNLPGGTLSETEPNNTASQAMSISLSDSVNAAISTVGDVDYYKFLASESDTVEILANATGTSNLEIAIQLYDANGEELASNGFFLSNNDARIVFAIPSTGTYFVRLTYRDLGGGFPNAQSLRSRLHDNVLNNTNKFYKKTADPTGEYRVRFKRFTATAPLAFPAGASNIYAVSAWVFGYVFPNGLSTNVTVQYGTTASYGQSASAGTVDGLEAQYPFATLTGLTPGTTYNYRIVATNSKGTYTSGNATFSTPPAPQGWSVQTSGTTSILWAVHSVNANVSTVVGEEGTILRTTNAGVSWVTQNSGTSETLLGVAFADVSTGLAVGSNGTILRTTNGGGTWTSQTIVTTNFLQGVAFPTASVATAVGDNGTILRSTNGGVSWVSQNSGTTGILVGVSFIDVNTGWAVGESGTIVKTTNGGQTWTTLNSNTSQFLIGVSFSDANNGTAVGDNGTVLRSTNGGTSWSLQTTGTSEVLWSVSFADANNGVVGGDNGLIYRTTNGGASWTVQSTGTYNAVLGISVGGNAVTAVGEYGMILRSASAVASITLSSSSISFGSVLVGSSSQQTLTVTCPSTSAVALNATNVSSNNTVFTASPTSFSLNPGSSQAVTVTFTPTAAGSQSGTLTISHNATSGSSSVSVSGTGITNVTGLTTATGRFSSGIPPSEWVLMSVPYTLDNTSASSTLSSQLTGSNPWKMYALVSGNYQDITNASDAFQLARGFWFKTLARSSAFNLNFGGGTVVTTSTYQVTVPTGWSLVGPPFYNNEATWSPVNTTAGSSGIRVWKYAHESNSWTGPLNPSVERMKPFGGYAVYNQTGAAATFTFTRGPVSTKIAQEWEEGDGWYIVLKVGNALLRIGEHRKASVSSDLYDYLMPPAPPDAVDEAPHLAGKLWSDIRPVDEQAVAQWKIFVNPALAKSIEVQEMFGIPSGWKILAQGILNVGTVSLEHGGVFTLPADISVPFTMTITAGPQDVFQEGEVPESFSLRQNYPNPFNPTTTIGYQLASEGDVSLKIYNVIGEEIVTLVHGFQRPGKYEIRWDGKNAQSIVVPSGVYFYTLGARTFAETRKMLFVR